jgi:hypothetical protein
MGGGAAGADLATNLSIDAAMDCKNEKKTGFLGIYIDEISEIFIRLPWLGQCGRAAALRC